VTPSSPNVETVLDGYRLGSEQGAIAFCAITLIEGTDYQGAVKRILVDTGHAGRRPALDAALGRRGLSRESIDIVVCTHAHWDHIENIDIFPDAEIVLHPDERRYARRPHRNDFGCPEWIDAVIARYERRLRTVEDGTTLLPGVEIVAAPGHSAGTIAVCVTTSAGIAVIAGDSIQNAAVARERLPGRVRRHRRHRLGRHRTAGRPRAPVVLWQLPEGPGHVVAVRHLQAGDSYRQADWRHRGLLPACRL
jgi:N-acyl homoserine lactone hydrolase